jgi:16S rRNA (uracil1498-N3)-methyltransferase
VRRSTDTTASSPGSVLRSAEPRGSGADGGAAARRAAAAQVLVSDPEHPLLGPEDARHLGRVLRLRTGETVVATDGLGRWVACRFAEGSLEPAGPLHEEAPGTPLLSVAFAPVKGERAEWVVQKLTELGIDRIVVLATERSVVRWEAERARAAMDRLRRVAREAACQSRRVWLPQLVGVVGLDALGGEGMALAEPGGTSLDPATTGVAIGPEGGWSPDELGRGWPRVALGPHVLRAETAALAAGTLLAAHRAGTVRGHGR